VDVRFLRGAVGEINGERLKRGNCWYPGPVVEYRMHGLGG
jgi:hypothetical protein